jgi:hypothetical protein
VITRYLPLLAASLRRKRLRTFFTLASIVVAFRTTSRFTSAKSPPAWNEVITVRSVE